jgi:glycyl-tRNA synthetase
MAEPKVNELMEKIVSLCKRRGFIYQSSEIYGGINGFWDYGPLGTELKQNVKEAWWKEMTRFRDDVVGLDATIIMSPKIWEASGHTKTFSDPMCDCRVTGKRFRADQVEPMAGTVYHNSGAVDYKQYLKVSEIFSDPIKRGHLEQHQQDVTSNLETALRLQMSEDPVEDKAGWEWEHAIMRREGYSYEPFEVLVPDGKSEQHAVNVAGRFYARRGVKNPVVNGPWRPRRVENTREYNPEKGEGFGAKLTTPKPFNLMFKTYVGPVADEENVAYLRPETAQAIFAQFKNVLETSRQKVPFGIAQVGKAFRNEVTPRNFTFRSREFEQMELEFFIRPDEAIEAIHGSVAAPSGPGHPGEPQSNWGWQLWHQYWVEERIRFYEGIGLPRESLVEYWQTPEELAHYARATVDILYKFPFSKRDEKGDLTGEELEGIAARSDFDLSQHQRFSGKPMTVFDEELKASWGKLDEAKRAELAERYFKSRHAYLTKTGEAPEKAEKQAREDAENLGKGYYVPHVIEPSAGVDRLILALICNAYVEDQAPDEKGKMETRTVMRFHPRIAPVKVAVFPLLKNKPELVSKAKEVRDLLRPHMTVFYDEGGAIGRRYRRQDEAGTPFGVTIDFETLGEKGAELKDTVTLRERDSMRQTRVVIGELLGVLMEKVR